MPTNYKQNDSIWAAYPYAGENMAVAGCGPTAVADLLDKSPIEIADWMTSHGYASNGSGTYHSGIYSCIRAYGYQSNKITTSSRAGLMNDASFETFKQSIQNGNCGILLMGGEKKGCKNDYWCKEGHYIGITGYENGKYRVYDPAWSARDGLHDWYDFQGNIKHVYTTNIKWSSGSSSSNTSGSSTTTGGAAYILTVPQIAIGSTGKYVELWQKLLKGRGFDIVIDGSFGNDTEKDTIEFQIACGLTPDGIVGVDTWRAMNPCYSVANGTSLTFTIEEITYGYNGAEAYFLQNLLRGYGYNMKLDFTYGDGCKAAVVDFKSKNGLDPKDLSCGVNTFKKLTAI